MAKKNTKQTSFGQQSALESKKTTVLGNPRQTKLPLGIAAVAAALLIGGGILAYVTLIHSPTGGATARTPSPAAAAATVSHPVERFADGKARHFEHRDGTITVRYFILKSSDGVLRAAFDACDVCWPAGKGYYQDGDEMVCRNCGRRFASVLVNEVKGGCNPAPLNRQVRGDRLVIQITDILEGKRYFNFSGKA